MRLDEIVERDGYNTETGKYQIAERFDNAYWSSFGQALQAALAKNGFSGKVEARYNGSNEVTIRLKSNSFSAELELYFNARAGSASKPKTSLTGTFEWDELEDDGYENFDVDIGLGRFAIWNKPEEYADDIASVLSNYDDNYNWQNALAE